MHYMTTINLGTGEVAPVLQEWYAKGVMVDRRIRGQRFGGSSAGDCAQARETASSLRWPSRRCASPAQFPDAYAEGGSDVKPSSVCCLDDQRAEQNSLSQLSTKLG